LHRDRRGGRETREQQRAGEAAQTVAAFHEALPPRG
jgi:hypothetical protein